MTPKWFDQFSTWMGESSSPVDGTNADN